ncbi:hypothetical protein [Labrys neptuniae]
MTGALDREQIKNMNEDRNLYSLKGEGQLLLCVCRSCGYRRIVNPVSLERYSHVADMAPVSYLLGRMRCTACGEKKVTGYGCPKGFPPNTFLRAGEGQFMTLAEAEGYAKAFKR